MQDVLRWARGNRTGSNARGLSWLRARHGWLAVLALATVMPGASSAETLDLLYDASLGTLPSAQGWVHHVTDPAPDDSLTEGGTYSVAGGVLSQGDTGGVTNDGANFQHYRTPSIPFSFGDEVVEVALRARVVHTTVTPAQYFVNAGSSGFMIWLRDDDGRDVYVVFGTGQVFLASTNSTSSPVHVLDTTAAFLDYVLRVDRDGARLSVGDEIVAELPYTDFSAGSSRPSNTVAIGDYWGLHSSTAEIESFRFTRRDAPEAVARDVRIVRETYSSTSGPGGDAASGLASCPTGMSLLSGGTSIVANAGAEDTLAIDASLPSAVAEGNANSWFGSVARTSGSGAFQIEVHAVCGEVPSHTFLVEDLSPPQVDPMACPGDLSRIGGREALSAIEDHISCAENLGWIEVTETSPANTDVYKEVIAQCPEETVLVGGDGVVFGDDGLNLAENHPETLFTDKPLLWVARGWRDGSVADPDPWQVEATAWCAPLADPTEVRPQTIGRWRGSPIGVFDEMGRRDGTFHNDVEGVPGLTGTAFELERANEEWIELERSMAFYPEGDFTVDAWIQTDSVDPLGGGHVIAEMYELGGVPGLDPETGINESHSVNWWTLRLTPDGFLEGRVRRLADGTAAIGDVDLADGMPHHVAMQRGQSHVRVFVDGVLAAETSISNSWDGQAFTPQGPTPDPVSIGAHRDYEAATTSGHWEGLIDDVKYHARALGEEELRDIAGCGLPILPRVVNLDADRFGGRADASDELRYCAWLEPGTYDLEIVSVATDPDARFTAWSEGAGQPWKTRVDVRPEIDAGFDFGDATGAATAEDAFANTVPTASSFTLTAAQRVYFGVEESGAMLDNRGGVAFRIAAPEPGFGVALLIGFASLASRRSRRG